MYVYAVSFVLWYSSSDTLLLLFVPQETLTGFKWMGNKSHELMRAGQEVLFAYEEAIGFMFGITVLDKDGISAAAFSAAAVANLSACRAMFMALF